MINGKSPLIAALVASTLLGGCASVSPWDSYETAELKPVDAKMVADDMVEVLVREYAPGKTTFSLASKGGAFGLALESELRETGFAIAPTGEGKPLHALSMAYVLDDMGQPGTYRVGLRVEPTYRMDRLYMIDSSGALVPGSGVTVRDGSTAAKTKPVMPANRPDSMTLRVPAPAPVPAIPASAEKLELSDYMKPDLAESWQVQVLAGVNTYDLEANQKRLNKLGREAHIVPLSSKGVMRAVRIGPLASAPEARAVMGEMRADRYKDAFVVAPRKGGRDE